MLICFYQSGLKDEARLIDAVTHRLEPRPPRELDIHAIQRHFLISRGLVQQYFQDQDGVVAALPVCHSHLPVQIGVPF
jgi:AraC-like DNA-binding protein